MLAHREGAAARRRRRRSRPPAASWRGAEPHMVGRALVAERGRHRRVDREMRVRRRRRGGAGRASPAIRGCDAAIVRRLATVRWQRPSAVSGAGETVAALAAHIAEAEKAGGAQRCRAPPRRRCRARPARRGSGRRWGRRKPCARPRREIVPHLLDALQRRGAREGDRRRLGGRGEVAEAEPRIIVARPDDAVEIDLDQRHGSAPDGEEGVARLEAEQVGARRRRASPPRPRRHGHAAVGRGEIGRAARRRAASSRPSVPSRVPPSTSSRASRDGADLVGRRRHGRAAVENVDIALAAEAFAPRASASPPRPTGGACASPPARSSDSIAV